MDNINKLKNTIYQKAPQSFQDLIKQAIEFAEKIHKDEKRISGEEYIVHPLNVAITLSKIGCDTNTIIAGILHDTKDETESNIKKIFGEDTFELIQKTKEIEKATDSTDTPEEIIVKYILNMSKDLRPVIIKLADKLHSIKTAQYLPEDLQQKKVQKTLLIYSLIAEYLNFNTIKKELEETAFKIYKPLENEVIEKRFIDLGIEKYTIWKYKKHITNILKDITPKPKINGRVKSKYSIYNKLKKCEKEWKNPKLETIEDLIGFRIITNTEENCYRILEKLMDNAEIITESFDDYISNPKPNGYMAMQGPIIFKTISRLKIEVQVLTEEMHYTNTYGTASHIAYKASKSRYAKPTSKYKWVEDIHIEIEKHKSQREQERNIPIHVEIFPEEIFVLTPKEKIIPLEKGDTALDFAFKVHTSIGNRAESVKVNGKPANLGQVLNTGDKVQIKIQNDKICQKEKALEYAHSTVTKARILRALSKYK